MADRRLMSQINVTPLVDVMLVLLIIFMVTAPMMEEGIDVNLPQVEASGLKTQEEPVVITLNKEGKLFINDAEVKRTELKKRLAAIFKRRAEKMVLLRADASVPYGAVVGAMAEIRRAGVVKIGMVTEPAWKGG